MIAALVKRIAGRVLRVLPERLVGRLLPSAFRFDPARMPPPPQPGETPVRLWVAPLNYAGQGQAWAAAAARLEGVSARNMVVRVGRDFRHPADETVPLGFYAASRRWQRREFDAVAGGFTHVIVEAERQPFGAVLDETTEAQVHRLLARGVRVAMLCHGTDIRRPSRHRAAYASSPFHDTMREAAPRLERIAAANNALLDRLGLPVFVSTPDLLRDRPEAAWLPVVVDPGSWRVEEAPLRRAKPVVVHAPSASSVKGSELVDPIAERLDAEGLIEYRRLRGIPFEQMRDAYRDADIVLDQFRLGDYGVAACEAMAAGRVVVGNVAPEVRARVEAETGRDLPVVQADAAGLETMLRSIVADREQAADAARSGPGFVTEVHDGRRSAERLAGFLGIETGALR